MRHDIERNNNFPLSWKIFELLYSIVWWKVRDSVSLYFNLLYSQSVFCTLSRSLRHNNNIKPILKIKVSFWFQPVLHLLVCLFLFFRCSLSRVDFEEKRRRRIDMARNVEQFSYRDVITTQWYARTRHTPTAKADGIDNRDPKWIYSIRRKKVSQKKIRIKAKIPNRIFCLSGENAHKKMESRTNGNKNSEKQNKT